MPWAPNTSLEHTERLLTQQGSLHQVHSQIVHGRLLRVYSNLWLSLRHFWLAAVAQYAPDIYIVFQDSRLTYHQVHIRAVKAAELFRDTYNVTKGDRVAICSRNCPDYLVAFWACHLIGAVAVLANAWLPLDPLTHCLVHTECKLIILDSERADKLRLTIPKIRRQTPARGFLVFDSPSSPAPADPYLRSFSDAVDSFVRGPSGKSVLDHEPHINPEDNATIIFTSGTTGLPKGVLSTQRQFLTNVLNVMVGGYRAALRRGEPLPSRTRSVPQKGALVAVPLFHVTGSTSYSMLATMNGMKIVMMRKWEVEEAVRLIKEENVTVAGGVPSMVSDLTMSSLVGHPLEGLLFGGAPAPDSLVPRARAAFPTATMIQGYGLTETNSIAVSIAGEDYLMRPSTTGLPSPVNEIRIVKDGRCLSAGLPGEVWLRGPNVMKCYWRDEEATNSVITADGWLKTGDVGYLDNDGFLYVKDRIKDIIIRGGENIDSVAVENALYEDPRVSEAVAVGVPDERLGELVAAIVYIREGHEGEVTEATLLNQVRDRLPRFAIPVMIVISKVPFARTPSGKIIKGELRAVVRGYWELRRQGGNTGSTRERLANL